MKDKIMFRIAFWLPKRLVYFCFIRVWSFATVGEYGNTVVSELTADEALRRWEISLRTDIGGKEKK